MPAWIHFSKCQLATLYWIHTFSTWWNGNSVAVAKDVAPLFAPKLFGPKASLHRAPLALLICVTLSGSHANNFDPSKQGAAPDKSRQRENAVVDFVVFFFFWLTCCDSHQCSVLLTLWRQIWGVWHMWQFYGVRFGGSAAGCISNLNQWMECSRVLTCGYSLEMSEVLRNKTRPNECFNSACCRQKCSISQLCRRRQVDIPSRTSLPAFSIKEKIKWGTHDIQPLDHICSSKSTLGPAHDQPLRPCCRLCRMVLSFIMHGSTEECKKKTCWLKNGA